MTSSDFKGIVTTVPRKSPKTKKANVGKPTASAQQAQAANPVGRPRVVISDEAIFTLRSFGHTISEIAEVFGCHRETMSVNYSTPLAEGRAQFLSNIRKAQMREALKGNARLLVHLGRSNLEEQKPIMRHELSGRDGKPIPLSTDPAEIERTLKQLIAEDKLIREANA